MKNNDNGASASADRATAVEPVPVSPLRDGISSAAYDIFPARRFYEEGSGGWNDGRLGQAYDLIAAALKERGQRTFRHPLLDEIELADREFSA